MVLAALALTFALAGGAGLPQPAGATAVRVLDLGYTGVDYYEPSDYFTHCPDYTWLQNWCYNNPHNPDPPREQLISDLGFVDSHGLGSTQRVWISLDQLMRWNRQTGFGGFKPGVLHNVDDMLALYHRFGMRVILVVYVYDSAGDRNEFRPQALDGNHAVMRRRYLHALTIFLRHLAGNGIDVSTAPIVELANEPYFQFEEYFNNPAHLGRFHACDEDGRTDWGCVDDEIIHPWLTALYHAATQASHRFLYTFSDTGRLLEDYKYWRTMYPQDVIDEHLYDSTPWTHASLYARARNFEQPWFASEVGCDVGATDCTYDGTVSAPVDGWWLQHLAGDGAQAVLVDSHVTLWQYPNGPNSQIATPTGHDVELATVSHAGLAP